MSAGSNAPIALDTSVILAALIERHEHHDRAFPVVHAALATTAVVPLPALIEAYAVMTRLPPPLRQTPEAALWLLRTAFEDRARIVAAEQGAAWSLLASLVERGVAGGATYDAHIALCARLGGARTLATFNTRDFERLDLGDLQLLLP